MNRTLLTLAAVAVLATGCAGTADTQQYTLGGALTSTAGGATIGSIAGDAGWGAATGVGVAGGYTYDRSQKPK